MHLGTRFGITELFEVLERLLHSCLHPFPPNKNLSGKYSDLYSGCARFESRSGNPLWRLRFFVKFLILRREMPE